MVRWLVIGGVAAVALTVYALVDLIVTGPSTLRAFPKPVWIALIIVLPVIGAVLWLTIGKNGGRSSWPPRAPDDDPGFIGTIGESPDERIKRLEEELRKLDEEDFSGEGSEEPPPSQ